jgi:hypothetical protein
MAEITVTKKHESVGLGDRDIVIANCASLATGATWTTGLGSVDSLFCTGQTEAQAYTWTATLGVVTFTVTAGPLLNVCLMAIGSM